MILPETNGLFTIYPLLELSSNSTVFTDKIYLTLLMCVLIGENTDKIVSTLGDS